MIHGRNVIISSIQGAILFQLAKVWQRGCFILCCCLEVSIDSIPEVHTASHADGVGTCKFSFWFDSIPFISQLMATEGQLLKHKVGDIHLENFDAKAATFGNDASAILVISNYRLIVNEINKIRT